MNGAVDMIGSVRRKGVELWVENGQLRYKAPRGALSAEELEQLRHCKRQILELLQTAECKSDSRQAPLTFSQQAHWRMYRLGERPAIRQVACAMRLSGLLSLDALQIAFELVVLRHDALRTRIIMREGRMVQDVDASANHEFRAVDLTSLSSQLHDAAVSSHIEQLILEPIDTAVGPLFGARLLRLAADAHVLILAMDHIISDGISLSILVRDLFTAYAHALTGGPLSWPSIPLQFTDYAIRQQQELPSWIEQHGGYWRQRLAGCERLRFPQDQDTAAASRPGWETVPVAIGKPIQALLRKRCRELHTTVAMGVFSAYAALVLRWCGTPESVIRYASDGRGDPQIANAIGFFASTLHLRVALYANDSFAALTRRVMTEYCNAYEHSDCSYLAAQHDCDNLTRNTAFNWLPEEPGRTALADLAGTAHALAVSPVPFGYPMLEDLELDREPGLLLYDTAEGISGDLYFPLDRFSVALMERFRRAFLRFAETLASDSGTRVHALQLD